MNDEVRLHSTAAYVQNSKNKKWCIAVGTTTTTTTAEKMMELNIDLIKINASYMVAPIIRVAATHRNRSWFGGSLALSKWLLL